MKNKKIAVLSMLIAWVMTSVFTACDKHDNTVPQYIDITKTEQEVYLNAMNGEYQGYLKFYTAKYKDIDSVQVKWNINKEDQSVTVKDFPISLVAQYLTNNDSLIVERAAPLDYKAQITFPKTALNVYYEAGLYFTYLLPPTYLETVVDNRKITLTFYKQLDNTTSRLEFQKDNVLLATILLDKIVVDNKIHEVKMPMIFYGEKIKK